MTAQKVSRKGFLLLTKEIKMKKDYTRISAIAAAMMTGTLKTDRMETENKCVQILPVPEEQSNALTTFLAQTRAFLVPIGGLRSGFKKATKKGAEHQRSKRIRSAVQLRKSAQWN